jgi:hypothetical protein
MESPASACPPAVPVSGSDEAGSKHQAFLVVLRSRNHRETVVPISSGDAARFVRFASASGLSNCPIDSLYIGLRDASIASDGLISRDAFITVTKRFISAFTPLGLSPHRSELDALNAQTSTYLNAFFSPFDRTNSDVADAAELACGLAILCSG